MFLSVSLVKALKDLLGFSLDIIKAQDMIRSEADRESSEINSDSGFFNRVKTETKYLLRRSLVITNLSS